MLSPAPGATINIPQERIDEIWEFLRGLLWFTDLTHPNGYEMLWNKQRTVSAGDIQVALKIFIISDAFKEISTIQSGIKKWTKPSPLQAVNIIVQASILSEVDRALKDLKMWPILVRFQDRLEIDSAIRKVTGAINRLWIQV